VPDARLISRRQCRPRPSRDVYCYFDNDIKVKAPFDAQRLMAKLGLRDTPPTTMHGDEPRVVSPLRPWPAPRKRALPKAAKPSVAARRTG